MAPPGALKRPTLFASRRLLLATPHKVRSSKQVMNAAPRSRKLSLAFGVTVLLLLAALGLAAPSPQESSSLLAQADEILQQMSELTGLPIKAPLQKRVISRPEVQKYLVENLRAEMTPRELHIQEATLQAFGLVSRDFNLEKFLIAFYTEQAAGFYDPRTKTMFIADWPEPEMQRMVLAHELTHALEDQNFDLQKFLHAERANDDATNAHQAIVEGHATAAMMQQMVEPVGLGDLPALEPLMAQVIHQQYEEFPTFSQAPYFFRLQALFPYVEGMGFMQRGLKLGGWNKLNTLFANPPSSTKEIFEPSVYYDRKPLPGVALPRPPALARSTGLALLSENILGELGYVALLGQLISEDEAKATATGWLADRYILYERTAGAGPGPAPEKSSRQAGDCALIARVRWSSTEIALAFFRDYHTVLAHKYPELAPDKRSATDLFIGSAGNGQVVLLRKGEEVLWAEGIPPAQADAVLNWLRSL